MGLQDLLVASIGQRHVSSGTPIGELRRVVLEKLGATRGGVVSQINQAGTSRARAAEARKQRDEIRSATREINTLKCEMHEIKDMLTILLDRK